MFAPIFQLHQCSGWSVQVSGFRFQDSALPLATGVAGLIEKKTLKKRIANIECGMPGAECRRDVFCLFIKRLRKAKLPSDILLFCGFQWIAWHLKPET
jgi:hypothetical protein